ncbi:MAG: hypothetical protein A2X45_15045 [Lentisphaerae bacterium GWF2_50_93]|nr:MAG: hypothetical protein A2X45_15045 [Lentisphaerae bacterium GWF2_50_93]
MGKRKKNLPAGVPAVRKEHGTPAPLPASAWEWKRKSAGRGAGGPGRAWYAGTLAGIGVGV